MSDVLQRIAISKLAGQAYTYSEKFKDYIIPWGENEANGQTVYKFPNSYVASVIHGYGSYGLEVAILSPNSKGKLVIDYDTPLTDDVIGYIDDLDEVLQDIYELPQKRS